MRQAKPATEEHRACAPSHRTGASAMRHTTQAPRPGIVARAALPGIPEFDDSSDIDAASDGRSVTMAHAMGDITEQDHRSRRCPMLGHDVHFSYCRGPGRNLPCRRILDCWFELFDVRTFVRSHYSEEQIAETLRPRQEKVVTLVELIRRAQAVAAEDSGQDREDGDDGSDTDDA